MSELAIYVKLIVAVILVKYPLLRDKAPPVAIVNFKRLFDTPTNVAVGLDIVVADESVKTVQAVTVIVADDAVIILASGTVSERLSDPPYT